MGYTDSLLADGEVVARRSRQHWLALLLESRAAIAVWVLAALLFAASVLFGFGAQDAQISNVIGIIVLVLVVLGLLLFAYRWLQWINQAYLITNRRILKVEGVLNKKSADSSLEKINDLRLEENLVGRMLGYGDLDIITAADTAIDRFRMLNDAKEFKRVMLDQKHRLESGEDIRLPGPPLMAGQPSREPERHEPASAQDASPSTPARQTTPQEPTQGSTQGSAAQEPAWQTAPQGPSVAMDAPSYGAGTAEDGPGATWQPSAATDPAEDETRGVPTVGEGTAGTAESAAAETMSTGLPADSAPTETGQSTVGGAGGGSGDAQQITQTLTRLADLRDRGAITSEEYEAKKADLLSRL
ncbi:MAG: PH domain-containing protein [Chloroflexota bacterium]|nr:PH domain-containing protein [Chloroflexota bacterium]